MLDNLLKKYFLFLAITFSYMTNAYAYIDPGTGSFIIQSILAIGGAIVFYLGYPIRIIKNVYYKIFKKNSKNSLSLDEKNKKKLKFK